MSRLNDAERDSLPADAFVFPKTREFPIPDENHARAALTDAAGTAKEAAVRKAVAEKFPSIDQADGSKTYQVRGRSGKRI